MSIETFRKVIPYAKKMSFIGGFGDFINHPQSLDFVREIGDKPFMIETNAGIRDESYWKELASMANDADHYVQFSVDEVFESQNPYRMVDTKIVLHNLKTFIDAGGYAVVKTIRFNFNEDKIPIMTEFFKSIGVKEYHTQLSIYYPDKGDSILSAPHVPGVFVNGTLPLVYKINEKFSKSGVKCGWKEGRWLYIVENGEVHRCCKLSIYINGMQDNAPAPISKYTQDEYYDDISEIYYRNKELINLNTDGVTMETIQNNEYFRYIEEKFKHVKRCKISCALRYDIANRMLGLKRIF